MLSEFREFIAKGNVMDLAVGVMIGAAFQKIVDSLVNDVITPVVGVFTGGTDFSNLFAVLKEGAKAPAPYASLAEAKAHLRLETNDDDTLLQSLITTSRLHIEAALGQ